VAGTSNTRIKVASMKTAIAIHILMKNTSNLWWIYALLSALFAAFTTILAKAGVEGVNVNLATAIRTVIILIITWGVVWVEGSVQTLQQISYKSILFLIFSGISTGLSWLFYFRALQLGKASLVAPIDKSSVILVLLLSTMFLGESLTWKSVLATFLVLSGILVLIL
jgi:transporter family protein